MERSLQAYQVIEEDLQDFIKLFKRYQGLNYKPQSLFSTDEEEQLLKAITIIDHARDEEEIKVIGAYEAVIPYIDNYRVIQEIKTLVSF